MRTSAARRVTSLSLLALVAAAILAGVGGCTSYYQVSDPASSRTYYTNDVDGQRGGAVRFKDAKTGAEVTLQSSEVKEIEKHEFESAVGKK